MKPSLARKRFAVLPQGRIAYLEAGARELPHLLLVHGIPTSSYLWRHVIEALSSEFHCVAPDLMGLGDTDIDPATTDVSMPAQAAMLDAFLDACGIASAHVVAHDQGGAAVQILTTRYPRRVDRLVLTDCVCYDNWPVPAIRQMMAFARVPILSDAVLRSGMMEWIESSTPFSKFRRGVSRGSRLSKESIGEYLRPLRGTPSERARFRKFLLAGDACHTIAVAPLLRSVHCPTLVIWGADDVYIPPRWGRRLFEDIPGAVRFELIARAGHFWQEERPSAFAEHIASFLKEERAKQGDASAKHLRVVPGCASPARASKHRSRTVVDEETGS